MIKHPMPRPAPGKVPAVVGPSESPASNGSNATDDIIIDFSNSIDSYIEKSPITNKFREENPNLRPVDDSSSNSTKVEESNQEPASAKRTLDLPFTSNNKKLASKLSYYSTLPTTDLISEYNGERLPSPSIDLTDIANETNVKTRDLPVDTSSQNSATNAAKKKLKRFSFHGLASNFKDNDRLNKKSNRFSLTSSLGRLSMSSNTSTAPSLATEESDIYDAGMNSSRTSLSSASEFSMMSTDTDFMSTTSTPFWKYHILKFGKDLYLTTNPGLKHVYCRNGPGYYVETIFPDKLRKPKVANGFSLVVKDINGIEPNRKDNRPPIMIVTKRAESEGGYLTISIPRQNQLGRQGTIMHFGGPNSHKSVSTKPMFNGLLIPKKISPNFIPQDSSNIEPTSPTSPKNGRFHHQPSAPHEFKNYEFKDFNNAKWNVGSIPRVRPSKMNRIKSRIRKTKSSSNLNPNPDGQNESEYLKFIGKKNIYFHQNYIEEEDWNNPRNTLYKHTSGDPSKIYLHNSDSEFPPVLGLFRPYETKARKRLVNSLNKNRSVFQNRPHTSHQLQQFHKLQNQQFLASNDSFARNSTTINRNSLSNDFAGGDVRNYFKGGDGLYYLLNPSDDTPDDNKLGWITIYEDQRLFSGIQNKGMFEIVLGLTLAVGFESCMD